MRQLQSFTQPDHLHIYSLALSLILGGALGTGCDDDRPPRPTDEIFAQCSEQEMLDARGECVPRSTPAHPPQCITVDGALCLINVTVRDSAPRPGALTPGEDATLGEMMVFNSGDVEVKLTRLSALVTSPHLSLGDPDWSSELVSGEEWVEPERAITVASRNALRESCQRGILPPNEGCTISLNTPFTVRDDAPVNASQRITVEAESQQGSLFSWSLPLNIVDAVEGLDLEEFSFEDSTEDGVAQPGDRLRFTSFKLLNSSFAPFSELRGLLVSADDQATLIGQTVRWEVEGERVEGLPSAEVICPQATSDESRALVPGECELRVSGEVEILSDLEADELNLTLYLRDREVNVSTPHAVTIALSPWEPGLSFGGLTFESDDNRDLLPSAGERITIRYITLKNQGDTAISFRGRVSVESPYARLSPASNLSVDETQLRDDFYESCPPQSSCQLGVNLILDINEDAPLGARIPIDLELIDHTQKVYLFESQFALVLPDIDLSLEELRITQDTLDPSLSPGERGVISYLKIVNEGLADALGLSVSISVDSPYITFEPDANLTFMLNVNSSEFDEMQSVCPSIEFEENGYCYSREEINFRVSEDTPLGEEARFIIEVTDLWGTTHELSHTITLF